MKKQIGWALALVLGWSWIAAASISRNPKYPQEWWQPVPRDSSVPSWEILPQDAGPGEVILSKRNELGILSNFAPTAFELRGKRFASLEGFWQSLKFPENAQDPRALSGLDWKHTRAQVEQMTAFDAKRAGDVASKNMEKMKINWVSFEGRKMEYRVLQKGEHYQLIVEAMKEKLKQNPEVRKILEATGDLVLMPDHKQSPPVPPAWRYHEIWMEIRASL